MTSIYELRNIGLKYSVREVLRGIDLDFRAHELTAIIGPNGAGKSTLLGVMTGLRPQHTGVCSLEGSAVGRWSRREFARRVALVPQSVRIDFPFSAEQVVMMGRAPFTDTLFESPEDERAVEDAMATTDTLMFRYRDFRTLSGGEKQRVILASALAQTPKALLLDEPTTFLDLQHQIMLYRVLLDRCRNGLCAIVVTHDLNLAAAFADRVVLLGNGIIHADGAPAGVIRPDLIREVFSADVHVAASASGRPRIDHVD